MFSNFHSGEKCAWSLWGWKWRYSGWWRRRERRRRFYTKGWLFWLRQWGELLIYLTLQLYVFVWNWIIQTWWHLFDFQFNHSQEDRYIVAPVGTYYMKHILFSVGIIASFLFFEKALLPFPIHIFYKLLLEVTRVLCTDTRQQQDDAAVEEGIWTTYKS